MQISSSLFRLCTFVSALLLLAGSCSGGECLTPPCPLPVALNLTLTSAATGMTVSNASIVVTVGAKYSDRCDGGVCFVTGYAGTYEIEISAPGYENTHRRVVVKGDNNNPSCGCAAVNTQRLVVALLSAI